MHRLKLTAITVVFALLAARDGPPAPPSPLPVAIAATAAYPSDAAMLRGEFARLRQSIDISTGGSIYAAYQTGRPLARAIFSTDDAQLKSDLVAHAAGLIRSLPTYGSIAESAREDIFAEAADSISPKVREARVALTGRAAKFDGLPLPYDKRFYAYRIFPLKDGGQVQINTGNIHQFGYYLSTLVRLGAADEAITGDSKALRDLQTIAGYLSHDFLRFFWLEAPAWHWSGAFDGGMKQRALARLDGDEKMQKRTFFRGFLDYDMHVMAVAADLKTAARLRPDLVSARDRPVVADVNRIAARVIAERVTAGADGTDFSFDRGIWDDNPIAQYGGCRDARLPVRPCPIKGYTIDISHAQRWPAWLTSFAAAASTDAERRHLAALRLSLAKRIANDIRYRDDRPLLTNFLDGRDGWFITTGSEGGHGAHPPSSLTGWAMRYGALAELADLDPRIAKAQQNFCRTITSSDPRDVRFRMPNYGEPEANPANGIRPMRDEYGAGSPYAHICRMVEIADGR
jgi:hypothetical protein